MTEANGTSINRATGLLIIEAINSNPNGDPDRESDPRQRPDGRGEISPVSFKRKLRDLIENKDGPVWQTLSKELTLDPEAFYILESRGRDRARITQELKTDAFKTKYWDGRIFGNTFLEEGGGDTIKTGVVQFGLGLSLAPIEVERHTLTNKAGVETDKDRGMAPLGFRVVRHAVYAMPFFVNPTAAHKSGCTAKDIELMLRLVPYAYAHTRSQIRPAVEVRHAWYIEHLSPIGSCSDFRVIAELTPRKKQDPDRASAHWDEYTVPTVLPPEVAKKVAPLRDLAGV